MIDVDDTHCYKCICLQFIEKLISLKLFFPIYVFPYFIMGTMIKGECLNLNKVNAGSCLYRCKVIFKWSSTIPRANM